MRLPPPDPTKLPLDIPPASHIQVPLQDPPRSSGVEYLARSTPRPAQQKEETPLLKAVKNALRGQDTDPPSVIQTCWFHDADNPDGRELAWNAKQVTLCVGGVMIKRWSFFQDKEDVQYACLGLIEQNALESPKHFTAASTQGSVAEEDTTNAPKPSDPTQRPTFGPFVQRDEAKLHKFSDRKETIPAVFIFLRSIAKIFLQTGISFTINIPFVVRRAWPLSPHGILIQRVLEPSELDEASFTGEPVLPTMFTITSPFQEPAAVGLASYLETTHEGAVKIHTEDPGKFPTAANVLRSIPPTEMVLHVSHPPENQHIHPKVEKNKPLVVTVDPHRSKLSIWVYAYADDIVPQQQPHATPAPSTTALLNQVKARQPSVIVHHNRRTSSVFEGERLDSKHGSASTVALPAPKETGTLGALNQDGFPIVNMPSSLSAAATTLSAASGAAASLPSAPKPKSNLMPVAVDERMKATYWMECVLEVDIPPECAKWWRIMKVAVFDERFNGHTYVSSVGICFRDLGVLYVFRVELDGPTSDPTAPQKFKATYSGQYPAMSIASVISTRPGITDLLAVTAQGRSYLLQGTSGIIMLHLFDPLLPDARTYYTGFHMSKHGGILDLVDVRGQTLSVRYENGWVCRANLSLTPNSELVLDCLRAVARAMTEQDYCRLHTGFLRIWGLSERRDDPHQEFEAFQQALSEVLDLDRVAAREEPDEPKTAWSSLGWSRAHTRCSADIVLRKLPKHALPVSAKGTAVFPKKEKVSEACAPVLLALHLLGEALRLQKDRRDEVVRVAYLICHIALYVRPEWVDYWMRLVPSAMERWPDATQYDISQVNDTLTSLPPDATSYLSITLNTPIHQPRSQQTPFTSLTHIPATFELTPCYTFGSQDPTAITTSLITLYTLISDPSVPTAQKRAETAIEWLLSMDNTDSPDLPGAQTQMQTHAQIQAQRGRGRGMELLEGLPLGVGMPVREALRTCQLAPPGHWALPMFAEIGRNDLAASGVEEEGGDQESSFTEGYRHAKEFMNPTKQKPSIGKIVAGAKAAAAGEVDATSGVELNNAEYGQVRFGHDKRLEEAARLLNSSAIPSIRLPDPSETTGRDKDHQEHLNRVSERTFSLSYGRAMFTFASISQVTRESHAIPKLEYSLKILPLNITVLPDAAKGPSVEAIHWAEFHNGVAAGLRISPTAKGVESSWITFNKPSELTPEHAGFLFALGLTGHLKELMTWHTFQYLTPKHDLTSIAVLLGLAVSNVGRGTQKVVKLLAVHTPALLPTPNVDLNVSLLTQAAGLSALGLLYLGMKNRRMAEVCLGEISRKDLVHQDLSNEHREAYTFSAAIAFGMIMLGKGSLIPADLDLVQRLTILLHGDVTSKERDKPINPFDINLTSPAAAIALGLMYLRTGRQDIADLLTIPDTLIALNRIQPSFLTIRAIARGLIMWDKVQPTMVWVGSMIPRSIRDAMKPVAPGMARVHEDAYELAYYHLMAGCCFVIGLKFAGTARHEAVMTLNFNYDLFSKNNFAATGPIYGQQIKRAAIRDGLSLVSLSLCMVMAGTGDIPTLRRIRQSYGVFESNMYHHSFRYGVHLANMQSLGLLFLGGGRSTLGTSDAAIAGMVAAFFPRSHVTAADNKCYLQALRHLWVLAVEPRCLVARDVDTGEVVFLPVKITVKEGDQVGTSQLVSPTLIPDIDKVVSIRVDTPRYWPFFLDLSAGKESRHRDSLLRNQTVYVKRRTAFLSYIEDPRGSRSLFVRSGPSSSDSAILDFPEAIQVKEMPGGDISEFITSFSNNIEFLAFADYMCRRSSNNNDINGGGEVDEDEMLFHSYCYSALLDCIMQDKPQMLKMHLLLYHYRRASPESKQFNLLFHDMRLAADFYGRVFERKFSGKSDNNGRPSLVRDTAVSGALHSMEAPLEATRRTEAFLRMLGRYVRNEPVRLSDEELVPQPPSSGDQRPTTSLTRNLEGEKRLERILSWYLLKDNIPTPVVLGLLKELAQEARAQCLRDAGPQVDPKKVAQLEMGIQEAMHIAGTKMVSQHAHWSTRSLDEYMRTTTLPR